jgi:hypothetical protein
MPSPEQPGGFPTPEHAPSTYCRAARFADEPHAQAVYAAVQDTIATHPCDLSSYRFFLDQIAHVAVVGAPPPRALDQQIEGLLAGGEPVGYPPTLSINSSHAGGR